ncbi:MAG: sulfatase-like hydrolase/transferase, partial [Bryobacterales bacterium]|nr:sulfatase-like hydrolase/transferase [Bryobacterales bacterium]
MNRRQALHLMAAPAVMAAARRPNILYVMTDDHVPRAMSCYGNTILKTPNFDRIANEGCRFDNAFCTNSLCAPSRASVLTGTYSHVNGI